MSAEGSVTLMSGAQDLIAPVLETAVAALREEGKVTHYNFPGDAYSDSNSRAGIGAWNNKLNENSLAISPDIESKFKAAGIGKGDPVELTLAD